jgi:hypothetical protein
MIEVTFGLHPSSGGGGVVPARIRSTPDLMIAEPLIPGAVASRESDPFEREDDGFLDGEERDGQRV